MIAEHTKAAIIALLAVDKSATDEEREKVATALRGEIKGPTVYTVKEVCERLGRSRQTVHNLVKAGLLTPVKGGGAKGYCTGITAESLTNYLTQK